MAPPYTLVRDHGGNLLFDSAPGQGTRARVTLPCPAEAPVPEETRRASTRTAPTQHKQPAPQAL